MNSPALEPHRFIVNLTRLSKLFLVLFAFSLPLGLAPENISFLLLAFTGLLSGQWWFYRRQLVNNPVFIFFMVLILIYFGGVFYSTASWHYSLGILKKYLGLLGIVVVMPLVFRDAAIRLSCFYGYLLGCLVLVIIAAVWQVGYLPHWQVFSQPGPYVVCFSIYASLFLAFAAFLALLLIGKTQKRWLKYFLGFCFVWFSYSLFFQNAERTGMLIYVAVTVVWFIARINRENCKRYFGVSILVVIAGGLIYHTSDHVKHRLQLMVSEVGHYYQHDGKKGSADTSMGLRLYQIKHSVNLLKQSPLVGHGTGSYRYVDNGVVTDEPQNTFAYMAAEHGLLGLAALLLLLFIQFRSSRIFEQKSLERMLILMLLVTFLIGSMSQSLLVSQNSRYFWLLFSGLLFAHPGITWRQLFLQNSKLKE